MNSRCNAKKFFEDLVKRAESANIASTCQDGGVPMDNIKNNLEDFIMFLFEGERELVNKCDPKV